MSTEVVHQPGQSRYVILSNEKEVGVANYVSREGDIMITGTFIDPAHRNEGLGAVLVRNTIDDMISWISERVAS